VSDTLSKRNFRLTRIANTLTIIRIVLAPILAAMVLYKNPWWLAFIFGWILAGTDKVDGVLARYGSPTRLGAFLDTLADKVLLLVVGWAIVYVDGIWWLPMAIISVREIGMMVYRTYWGKKGLAMPARQSGKYKAFMQGVALSAAMLPPLEPYPNVISFLIWVAVAFTLFSAGQYIVDGRAALSTSGVLEKT